MAQNPNISQLDAHQIAKRVYDPIEDRIRVDAQVTASISNAEVVISQVDDSIRIGDGTNLVTSTTVAGDVGLDVNVIGGTVTGELTASGLTTAGKITTMNISDTAVAIPSSPLADRNSLALTNLSNVDTIYIGFSTSVTADQNLGLTAGWEVGPNEGFNLDIKDTILIYGITETGKTVRVKVMELA